MSGASKTALAVMCALVLAVGIVGGIALERYYFDGEDEIVEATGERQVLYWVAPMDPNFRRDGPGKSPMGMDLIPVYEGDEPGGGDEEIVRLSPAMVQNLGVRTSVVERTELKPMIETFGTVAFDETRTSHVHVRAEGWIEKLYIRAVGEPVEQGQVLFEIFSPDLATAAWEYVRELQRGNERLYEGGRRKLLALGADPRQIDEIRRSLEVPDRIKVYAPRTGVAVALNVADGMYVEPDMTTVSITDPSAVWLLADVFESQAAFVFEGMKAEARVAGIPGRVWHGVVDYIYADLRPETRTVQLRLTFQNDDLRLKPNMYASVSLFTRAKEDVLAVPAESVIRTGRSERVVLALGDGRFKSVPVKIGSTVGNRVEILQGVTNGDEVVVSAQFLIDSESSLTAGFRQMQDTIPETAMEAETAPEPVSTMGRIEKIDAANRKATVTHDPIPSLGWPAMTMDFNIDPAVSMEHLAPGSRISIGIAQGDDGLYRIVTAENAHDDAQNEPMR